MTAVPDPVDPPPNDLEHYMHATAKYRDEAHLLTRERDEAVELLRQAREALTAAEANFAALRAQLYLSENKMAQTVIRDLLSYAEGRFDADVSAYLRMVLKIYADAEVTLSARASAIGNQP